MKFKSSKALFNWYGVSAPAGVAFEMPDHLLAKAENMPFLTAVKRKTKAKTDGNKG